jgi:hypothetical protein
MEQFPDFHPNGVGNVFESRYRRSVNAPLYQANEIDGVVRLFGELFLGKVRLKAEMGNIPAKQSI